MSDLFTFLENAEIVKFFAAIFAAGIIMMLVSRIMMDSRRMRLEERKAHIELDLLRARLESEVYEKNARLTKSKTNFNDVNHLVIDSMGENDGTVDRSNAKSNSSIDSFYFKNLGISPSAIQVTQKLAFVLTPHHPKFEEAYSKINRTLSDLGFTAKRGDEVFVESNILSHIVKQILAAEIVIANIDGRNPNVFYELGIAQAVGKPVIILTSEIEEAPFDVSSQKLVVWDTTDELERGLIKALAIYGLSTRRD